MKLNVIGTGSAGNSYLLTSSTGKTLIIECGVRFSEIKKALKFNLRNVEGTLCTHHHQDHCKGAKDLTAAGLNLYCLKETSDTFKFSNHRIKNIAPGKQFELGEFKILPFSVEHDVPCLGFLIYHWECGRTLFLTDSFMVKQRFSGLNNIIIEANYGEDILDEKLDTGGMQQWRGERLVKSHMSIETCIGVLKANDLSNVNNIILIHLSDSNSDKDQFLKKVQDQTQKTVHVAHRGLEINLNLHPF